MQDNTLLECYNALSEFTDPIHQAIARKAILQAGVLGLPGAPEADLREEQPVTLGIFRVLPTTALIDWQTPSGDLRIIKDDVYLDFHMPKADENITNTAANYSYEKIATWLLSRPEIGHILGVTYGVMAQSAKIKQGFTTEEVPLPDKVMDLASAYWQSMMPGNKKPERFASAHAVWHTRESFLDRFLSS